MLRMLILAASACAIGTACAGERRQIDATPFAHAPCSPLDPGPCTPSYCGVFNHGPCIPEMNYPYGQNLQLTVRSNPPRNEVDKYAPPDHALNTIGDLLTKLRSCWVPPVKDRARAGMQISVRFSFRRSGEMIGPPQLTYATPGVAAGTREAYLAAVTTSLNGCLPLKFTDGLGGAIAGRPIMIRYIDDRGTQAI